ncbi:PAS-domain containing protein, partial [Acinetobacter baumannii]
MRPGARLAPAIARKGAPSVRVIQLPDGRKTAVRHDAMPDGNTVTIFTDVTAEKAAEAKLTRLAMLDPLTELPNRRAFLEAAEGEIN